MILFKIQFLIFKTSNLIVTILYVYIDTDSDYSGDYLCTLHSVDAGC